MLVCDKIKRSFFVRFIDQTGVLTVGRPRGCVDHCKIYREGVLVVTCVVPVSAAWPNERVC